MSLDPLTKLRRPGVEPKSRDWREHISATLRELEQFRGSVHLQLDALEQMARQRAVGDGADPASAEELMGLRRRVGELESANERLEAEAGEWRVERQALLDRLEHDRRQISEAWEVLERERIANPPQPTPRAPERPAPAHEPVPAYAAIAAIPAPAPKKPSGSDDDVVAQEILRQFQTLRRDVRRTANDTRRD